MFFYFQKYHAIIYCTDHVYAFSWKHQSEAFELRRALGRCSRDQYQCIYEYIISGRATRIVARLVGVLIFNLFLQYQGPRL